MYPFDVAMPEKSTVKKCLALIALLSTSCGAAQAPAAPSDHKAAEAAPPPLCDPTVLGHCVAAAQKLEREQAQATFEYGCSHDDLDSCYFLSTHLMSVDPERGMAAMQDACERGYRFACVQYGNLFFADGPAWKQDYTKSHEYFEKACGGMVAATDPPRLVPQGQAYGCTNLGVLYENAWGVERDGEKAHVLSKFACDLDYGNGCNQVGVFIRRGWVAEPDEPPVHYFLKACAHTDGTGCCNVATELSKGDDPLDDGRDAEHFSAKAREYHFDCEKWEPIPPSSRSDAVE